MAIGKRLGGVVNQDLPQFPLSQDLFQISGEALLPETIRL